MVAALSVDAGRPAEPNIACAGCMHEAPRLAPSESGALEQVDPRQISRGRPPFAPPPTTAPTYATSYKYTRRTGHRGGSGASFPCIFALWKHHLRTFFSFWMALAGLLWSWLAQCEAHVFVLGQGRTSQVAEMVTALGSPPTPARSLTIRLPRTPRQDLRLGKDKAPFGGGGFAPPPRVPRLVTYLRTQTLLVKPHVSTICTVRDGLRVATLAKVDGNRAKQPVDHLDVAGQLIRDGLVQGRGLALDSHQLRRCQSQDQAKAKLDTHARPDQDQLAKTSARMDYCRSIPAKTQPIGGRRKPQGSASFGLLPLSVRRSKLVFRAKKPRARPQSPMSLPAPVCCCVVPGGRRQTDDNSSSRGDVAAAK
ncbi:hypothetical protein ACCO45_001741 [Purpureocillium lilacinum]|uniref:Uncharacterized protein n=1 Tax=Purpureocillium lilacinum TaxID=33203 RepID=A0ACC4E919_PURLI